MEAGNNENRSWQLLINHGIIHYYLSDNLSLYSLAVHYAKARSRQNVLIFGKIRSLACNVNMQLKRTFIPLEDRNENKNTFCS